MSSGGKNLWHRKKRHYDPRPYREKIYLNMENFLLVDFKLWILAKKDSINLLSSAIAWIELRRINNSQSKLFLKSSICLTPTIFLNTQTW